MHETFRVLTIQRETELQREAASRHLAAAARTPRSRRVGVGRRARTAIVGLAVAMLLTAGADPSVYGWH